MQENPEQQELQGQMYEDKILSLFHKKLASLVVENMHEDLVMRFCFFEEQKRPNFRVISEVEMVTKKAQIRTLLNKFTVEDIILNFYNEECNIFS